MRSTSIGGESGEWVLGGRDESAFYQAETQMLTRENQMLKLRVAELEREKDRLYSVGSPVTHGPPHHSNLTRSSTVADKEEGTTTTESPRDV